MNKLLLSVALASAACGGGSSDTRSFVGSWKLASGNDTFTCPSGTTMSTENPNDLALAVTASGSTLSLAVTSSEAGLLSCTLSAKVSGDDAALGATTCTSSSMTFNVMSGTTVVADNVLTLDINASGVEDNNESCTANFDFVFAKQ